MRCTNVYTDSFANASRGDDSVFWEYCSWSPGEPGRGRLGSLSLPDPSRTSSMFAMVHLTGMSWTYGRQNRDQGTQAQRRWWFSSMAGGSGVATSRSSQPGSCRSVWRRESRSPRRIIGSPRQRPFRLRCTTGRGRSSSSDSRRTSSGSIRAGSPRPEVRPARALRSGLGFMTTWPIPRVSTRSLASRRA